MNIKFTPQDPNHAPNLSAMTNVGSFLPGEVRGLGPDQEAEALRLVANGDFVETDEEPNADKVAANMEKAMKKFEADAPKRAEARAKAAAAEADTAKTSKK